jgi:hypothetical protein
VGLLLETGLLLVLIPWSGFWERNYFVESSASLGALLTNNYTRGAISGLGLVNVWAALSELGDAFGWRGRPPAVRWSDNPPPDPLDQ